MNTNFSTIDEYIANFDIEAQKILQEVRKCIQEVAPEGTTETISYKMPTFRYNGNLIHFALFKKHLGIYPGSRAIAEMASDLGHYKTSKGAIQIPFNKKVPRELIQRIVLFNVELLKDKKGPNWHKHQQNWQDCIEIMVQIVETLNLQKEFKWGTDIYTFQGKNIIGWSGFKNFFSLWFYNGVFLEDKENVLISASEGKTKALRQWRFTDAKEMNSQKIRDYILESIQTVKDGKEIKPEKSEVKAVTGIFFDVLQQDDILREAFYALTNGRQKEYIEYIDNAKQEKTKRTRIEKITPLILAKQGLNDKYKK